MDHNNRAGIGIEQSFDNGWSIGADISDGTSGIRASAQATYGNGDANTAYFRDTLGPARTYGTDSALRDTGRFVVGGAQQITDWAKIYAENSFDLLGHHQETIRTFGIDITASELLTLGASMTDGRASDPVNGDLSRSAVSFSAAFEDESLSVRARLEYRQDREMASSGRSDIETIAFSTDAVWKIDDTQRLLLGVTSSKMTADTGSLLGGSFTQAAFGYA